MRGAEIGRCTAVVRWFAPARKGDAGAARVDPARRKTATLLCGMVPLIEQDVAKRVLHLEWRGECASVESMDDELAAPPEEIVQSSREARAQAAHATCEAVLVITLDDHLDVIGEHAEFDDVKAEASARGTENPEDARVGFRRARSAWEFACAVPCGRGM